MFIDKAIIKPTTTPSPPTTSEPILGEMPPLSKRRAKPKVTTQPIVKSTPEVHDQQSSRGRPRKQGPVTQMELHSTPITPVSQVTKTITWDVPDQPLASEFNESQYTGLMQQMLGYFPESTWYAPVDNKLRDLTKLVEAQQSSQEKRTGFFNSTIAKRLIEFYSQPGQVVLDPLGDWGTIAMIASYLGRQGFFTEIVPDYLLEIQAHLQLKEAPVITQGVLADARNLPFTTKSVDYILTAPPTWNLERYDSVPGQLGDIIEYSDFLRELEKVIGECYRVLQSERYMTLSVHDFRKHWKLYNYHGDIIQLAEKAGFTWHDLVINKQRNTGALVGARKCVERHYMVRTHEYLLTFYKA